MNDKSLPAEYFVSYRRTIGPDRSRDEKTPVIGNSMKKVIFSALFGRAGPNSGSSCFRNVRDQSG